MKNLHVGILGSNHGWRSLMEQEGVPFDHLTTVGDLHLYSVIIVGESAGSAEVEVARAVLSGGGAVLCAGEVYRRLTHEPCSMINIGSIYGDEGTAFSRIGAVDLFQECLVPSSANVMMTSDGRPTCYAGSFGNGYLVVLPFDAGRAVMDERVRHKSFFSRRARMPHERVSAVAKGEVRRLVSRALELLHHAQGLPYVHVWRFPSDARSVCSLRIDTDFATPQSIMDIYTLAARLEVPFTWFIHVNAHRELLSAFAKMTSHEIGIHCDRHIELREEKEARTNIEQAQHALSSAGLVARSFAAPYGLWTPGLGAALEQFDVDYSSEFSYDYDNVPSFPMLVGKATRTLQLPIHPVSIGSLRRQSYDETEMVHYFNDIIDAKLAAREPLFLYHHPLNGHLAVLESILTRMKENNIAVGRMIDFAIWWKKRLEVKVNIRINDTIIHLDITSREPTVWLHVTRSDGMEAFAPMDSQIQLDRLTWQLVPVPASRDHVASRGFNPWIPINLIEDRLSQVLYPRS